MPDAGRKATGLRWCVNCQQPIRLGLGTVGGWIHDATLRATCDLEADPGDVSPPARKATTTNEETS